MPDPAERFIEAAVRPMEDNAEMQILAGHELRTAITQAAARPGCDSIDLATSHLETGGLPRWFKTVLYGLTALAAVLVTIPLARDYQHYRLATFTLFGMSDPDIVRLPGLRIDPHAARKTPEILGDFTPVEKLLLFPDHVHYPEPFKVLWDTDPTNAAYFAEHARACGSPGTPKLPVDYLKTADDLDPENGWFRAYAAGVAARDAVEENPAKPRAGKAVSPLPTYVVKDPAKLAEAMVLLEEAAQMPRFDSYKGELFLRRIAILPPGTDTLERLFVVKYLEMFPERSVWIYRLIAQAVTVKSQELALAGDKAGFLKVTASWESFVRRSIKNSGLPPGGVLWSLSGFAEAARDLAVAAKTLGLTEKSDRYQRLADELKRRKIATNNRSGEARELVSHGGFDADRLIYPIARLENPPPLDQSDLRPGYLADSAKRERLKSATMGVMLLLTALLFAIPLYLRGPQTRRLSASLTRVLQPRDHAWILIGGVLLPVLFYVVTEPLEAKPPGHFIMGMFLIRMASQAAALMFAASLIVHRRFERRLGCAGWSLRGMPEPLAIGLGLLLIIMARFTVVQTQSSLWILASACLACFGVAYLALPVVAIFSRGISSVFWLTSLRTLLPAHLLAALLMALLVPLHHAREKHWTRLNVLTKIEPGIPAMNRYEHEVEEQVR
jgi:hypothetical protein